MLIRVSSVKIRGFFQIRTGSRIGQVAGGFSLAASGFGRNAVGVVFFFNQPPKVGAGGANLGLGAIIPLGLEKTA